MNHPDYKFSVFTKMWPTQPIAELATYFKNLGLDGVELAVRSGFQLEPANAEKGLRLLAKQFEEYGLKIFSTASVPDENVFAGCAEAGIPLIRVCIEIDRDLDYVKFESDLKKKLEQIQLLCEKYDVKYGIQPHCEWFIQNSMQVMHLVEAFDPRYIGVVWDAGHSGLAGEEPEMSMDMVWSHLCMINLKNAFYSRVNGPEANEAKWQRHWTTGRNGLSSWKRISEHIRKKEYKGVICLPAEYTDEPLVDRYLKDDIAYLKTIINQGG